MELRFEQEINASADKVWGILGHQFADIGDWAPGVQGSRVLDPNEIPVGVEVAPNAPVPGRATGNRFGETKEILVKYSDEDKTFTFQGVDLPPIFSHAANTTRVIEQGADQSLVTFDVQMIPKGPFKLFSPLLRRRFSTSPFGPGSLIKDLKQYAETGQAS